jgi:hypothetical protein
MHCSNFLHILCACQEHLVTIQLFLEHVICAVLFQLLLPGNDKTIRAIVRKTVILGKVFFKLHGSYLSVTCVGRKHEYQIGRKYGEPLRH